MRRGEPPIGAGLRAQVMLPSGGTHDIGIAPNGQFYVAQHPSLKAEIAMAALTGEDSCCGWVLHAYRNRSFRMESIDDEEGGGCIEDAIQRQSYERTFPRERLKTTLPPETLYSRDAVQSVAHRLLKRTTYSIALAPGHSRRCGRFIILCAEYSTYGTIYSTVRERHAFLSSPHPYQEFTLCVTLGQFWQDRVAERGMGLAHDTESGRTCFVCDRLPNDLVIAGRQIGNQVTPWRAELRSGALTWLAPIR